MAVLPNDSASFASDMTAALAEHCGVHWDGVCVKSRRGGHDISVSSSPEPAAGMVRAIPKSLVL
jgi:hypothetical protein